MLFLLKSEYTLQECNVEEFSEEDEPPKSSKDSKKANGPEKDPTLIFKITSKVAYKTVLKGNYVVLILICVIFATNHDFVVFAAHSTVVLKAESMADKVEWVNKIRNISGHSKGTPSKGASDSEAGLRQSHSDGSLVSPPRMQYLLSQLGRKKAFL